MADPEALAALRQQVEQLEQQLREQQLRMQNEPHSPDDSVQPCADYAPQNSAPTVAVNAGAATAADLDVWRTAVKLPPFWADSPEVWFAQVEAQFSLARITQDRTRYDYVVAHMDARYANEVRDILVQPPTANLYEYLKTELIRRLSLSEDQSVRQLQSAELAERKPSQLLRHVRALAGNMEVQESFLRSLWLGYEETNPSRGHRR